MKRVEFGKTDFRVSQVVLGGARLTELKWRESVYMVNQVLEAGINFLDTAVEQGSAEERIGDTFLIPKTSTKAHFSTRAASYEGQDMTGKIAFSLSRIKNKPIQVYAMADLDSENIEQAMKPGGALSAMVRAKNTRKIRYLGYHTTDPEIAMRMLDEVVFDVAVVPVSFYNTSFIDNGFIKEAKKKKLAVLGLEPCGNAGLGDIELALKFLAQYPSVRPVINFKYVEELELVITLLKKDLELDESDRALIEELRERGPREEGEDDETGSAEAAGDDAAPADAEEEDDRPDGPSCLNTSALQAIENEYEDDYDIEESDDAAPEKAETTDESAEETALDEPDAAEEPSPPTPAFGLADDDEDLPAAPDSPAADKETGADAPAAFEMAEEAAEPASADEVSADQPLPTDQS